MDRPRGRKRGREGETEGWREGKEMERRGGGRNEGGGRARDSEERGEGEGEGEGARAEGTGNGREKRKGGREKAPAGGMTLPPHLRTTAEANKPARALRLTRDSRGEGCSRAGNWWRGGRQGTCNLSADGCPDQLHNTLLRQRRGDRWRHGVLRSSRRCGNIFRVHDS